MNSIRLLEPCIVVSRRIVLSLGDDSGTDYPLVPDQAVHEAGRWTIWTWRRRSPYHELLGSILSRRTTLQLDFVDQLNFARVQYRRLASNPGASPLGVSIELTITAEYDNPTPRPFDARYPII